MNLTISLFSLSQAANLDNLVNIPREKLWLRVEKIALIILINACRTCVTLGPLLTSTLSFIPTPNILQKTLQYPRLVILSITMIAASILLIKGPSIIDRLNKIHFHLEDLSTFEQFSRQNEITLTKRNLLLHLKNQQSDRLQKAFEKMRETLLPQDLNSMEYLETERSLYQCISTQFLPEIVQDILDNNPEIQGNLHRCLISDLEIIRKDQINGIFIASAAHREHVWPTKDVTLLYINMPNQEPIELTYAEFLQTWKNSKKTFADCYSSMQSLVLNKKFLD